MNIRCIALALAIAFGLAGATARAQVIDDEAVDVALTGQITVVDVIAKTLALQGANGESTIVRVTDKTTLMSGSKKIGLDALHKGDWVAVDADRRGATVTATFVEVVDDPNDPSDDGE